MKTVIEYIKSARRRILISLLALLCGVAGEAAAGTRVMVLGGMEAYGNSEAPFPPDAVATNLQRILEGDAVVEAPVLVQAVNASRTDGWRKARTLTSWYYWPTNHTDTLTLLASNWNHVVLIDDPSVHTRFPEHSFEGFFRISQAVRQGGGNPLLLMTWPSTTPGASLDTFGEMAYRIGDGLGIPVVPAGYAWNAVSPGDWGLGAELLHEAETQTLVGCTIQNDATASGGQYVAMPQNGMVFLSSPPACVATVRLRYRASTNGAVTANIGGSFRKLSLTATAGDWNEYEFDAGSVSGSSGVYFQIQAGDVSIDLDWIKLIGGIPVARPNARGSYVTAAAIYSQLFNRSAKSSTFIPAGMTQAERDAIADTVLATVQNEGTRSHYSGPLRRPTHAAAPLIKKRLLRVADFNSSTEWGIRGQYGGVFGNIDVQTTWIASPGYQSFPSPTEPIEFCQSRFADQGDTNKWFNYACFDYQADNGQTDMVYAVDAILMDIAKVTDTRMNSGTFFVPLRLLWARAQEVESSMVLQESDGHHLTAPLLHGMAAMMATLLTGRCPVGDQPAYTNPPSDTWKSWLCRKIGYELVTQHAALNPRLAGFLVLPRSISAVDLSPVADETLTVRFRYPPTSNVTVNISCDQPGQVVFGTNTLLFTPQNYATNQTITARLPTTARAAGTVTLRFDTVSADSAFNNLHDEWDYNAPANSVWDGGGPDANWNSATNWNPDGVPAAGYLTFAGASRLTNYNNLTGFSTGGIQFDSSAGAFMLTGNALLLATNAGINFIDTPASPVTHAINLELALTNGTHNITVPMNATLVLAGPLSGPGDLKKSGLGTLTLSGANLFSGNTTLFEGRLNINSAGALSTGKLIVTGSTMIDNTGPVNPLTLPNTNIELRNNLAYAGSATNTLSFGSGIASLINGNRSVVVSAGTLVIGSLDADIPARTFTKTGAGTLALLGLAGTNLQGTVTISIGGIALGHPRALGSGVLVFAGSGLATLQGLVDLSGANRITNTINAASFGAAGTNSIELSGLFTWGGTADRILTNALASGAVLKLADIMPSGSTAARTLSITGSGETRVVGSISDGGTAFYNNISKAGVGLAVLSGANSYRGVTTISGGTLQFATTASLYGGVTASWTAANIKVASNAVLAVNVGGPGEFPASDLSTLLGNLGALGGAVGAGQGLVKGAKIAFDTTNAAGGVTLADNLANSTGAGGGAIGVVKLGAGMLTLGGSNSFTGGLVINNGTLKLGGNSRLPSNAVLALIGPNAGFDLDSYSQTIGALSATNGGTVNIGGGVLTVSGSFTNTVTLAIRLTAPNTAGMLALAGAAQLGGTLRVDASAYTPWTGDSFTVLMAAGVSGTFAATDLPALAAGLSWQVVYQSTAVVLRVTGTASNSSYAAWARNNQAGLGSQTNLWDDPGNRGLPNLARYAFGGSATSGAEVACLATALNPTNRWFTIRFQCNSDAQDLSYFVDDVPGLGGTNPWNCILSNILGSAWQGAMPWTETPPTNGVSTVEVTYTNLSSSHFFRTRVTKP
jgi:autotransporter-associated beta strand protein